MALRVYCDIKYDQPSTYGGRITCSLDDVNWSRIVIDQLLGLSIDTCCDGSQNMMMHFITSSLNRAHLRYVIRYLVGGFTP
jgi:hypothetical protein